MKIPLCLATLLLVPLASCTSDSGCRHATRASVPTEAVEPAAMEVVPLHFAVAQELAATLNQVLGERDRHAAPAAPLMPSTRVVADPRTNSLIVRASRESLPHVLELIRRLDREIE